MFSRQTRCRGDGSNVPVKTGRPLPGPSANGDGNCGSSRLGNRPGDPRDPEFWGFAPPDSPLFCFWSRGGEEPDHNKNARCLSST